MNGNMESSSGNTDLPLATREQFRAGSTATLRLHEIELAMTTLAKQDGRYCWAEMRWSAIAYEGWKTRPHGCMPTAPPSLPEPAIVAPLARRTRGHGKPQDFTNSAAWQPCRQWVEWPCLGDRCCGSGSWLCCFVVLQDMAAPVRRGRSLPGHPQWWLRRWRPAQYRIFGL